MDQHAQLTKKDGHHYVAATGPTWVNDKQLQAGITKQLRPGDVLAFGSKDASLKFKIKMCACRPDAVSCSII